jgi:hypothetical protein
VPLLCGFLGFWFFGASVNGQWAMDGGDEAMGEGLVPEKIRGHFSIRERSKDEFTSKSALMFLVFSVQPRCS